jgi:hypothetical protein
MYLPRTRGFTGHWRASHQRSPVSSPHAGVHRCAYTPTGSRSSIFPARGGSPDVAWHYLKHYTFLPVRGGSPHQEQIIATWGAYLPRARGSTVEHRQAAVLVRVSSPHAGVHRRSGVRAHQGRVCSRYAGLNTWQLLLRRTAQQARHVHSSDTRST